MQDGEAGGITQQIGATNMPQFAITEWSKSANVKGFDESTLKLPGFLVIDTPGVNTNLLFCSCRLTENTIKLDRLSNRYRLPIS